ncbi:MAG TPA: DUF6607 family protein [Burkholderiaceae bacterium]
MAKQGFVAIVGLLGVSLAALAQEPPRAAGASAAASRYTFSWPIDAQHLKPRGGSTRGAPVTLDREPPAKWLALQQPGLVARERDRRAILAMAGTYRVTFDFLEVAEFVPSGKTIAPYQSWATEKVYVDQDQPGFVSLVHILEMRMLDKDGAASEPMVTKHWRQDWTYEPAEIVEYKGRERWERRALGDAERRGTWLQAVYQVDESPRYASVGRWQHTASFSSWLSGDTWRPLPRREWSVRDDYQVLVGTNRHTITPIGWLQEENNLKAVLNAERAIDATKPYVGREYGVARYERIRDVDFAAADRYYARTRAFWDRVRDTWRSAFAQQGTVTLRGPVDKLGLYRPLFERADAIEAQRPDAKPADERDSERLIRAALVDMGVPL